jgi:DeoR/GlpR family transcriptional regulator of sugar metabolism
MINELPLARRDAIAACLRAGQAVSSVALATEFNVSEDAIRRDLRALAAAGFCRRVYGGALPLTPGTTPLTKRLDADVERKRSLAKAALSLIKAGSFVFLDNGSTSIILAEELPRDSDLIVATSSIEIASRLAARGDVHIHMVGGQVDTVIGGAIDGIALEAVGRLNIDTCFLGVCALSVEGGVSAFDPVDATFKRALVARSRKTLILVTTEKMSVRAPHRVAELSAIDRVVVEHDAPEPGVEELRAAGANILRAEPNASPRH